MQDPPTVAEERKKSTFFSTCHQISSARRKKKRGGDRKEVLPEEGVRQRPTRKSQGEVEEEELSLLTVRLSEALSIELEKLAGGGGAKEGGG